MSLANWRQVLELVYDSTLKALAVKIVSAAANSGRAFIDSDRVDYTSGVGITTSAYTTVEAALASASNKQNIFHQSVTPMILAINDVDQLIIPPGGIEQCELFIPSGASVKIKAIGANITTGQLIINFYA